MDFEPNSLTTFLTIFWFIVYWVLGGVFFAVLTILKLGRIKKVRFSCLFTLLAAACGYGAAYYGTRFGNEAIGVCLNEATTKAEVVMSLFGCGFSSVFGAFLVGASVLTLGGMIFMAISKSKSKPWITMEKIEDEPHEQQEETEEGEEPLASKNESKFF
jgi:hypothetical protein